MPYYKDTSNGIHFLDDAVFAYMLPADTVEITDTEARAAQAAANEPSPEQVLAATNSERDSLLATASLRIAPLQDAVDLGTATIEDTANLKLWKIYRIAVSRVSTQVGFPTTIDWPAPPA